MWLKEFLPNSFSKVRIMTFNHYSGWQFNAPVRSVDDYGESRLAALGTVRKSAEVCFFQYCELPT